MKSDIIAIIGAGEAALPIIYKAKAMGVKTIAFARNNSLAQDLVDIFVEENSFDIQFIASKCRELGVNGVMASSELTTEVAAKVAHELNLPGNDVELGFAGKNKYLMRCRVQNLKSVKQPKFELYDETHEYSFPVVVKAIDSCGKRGVGLAKNKEEFIEAVKYAKENSSDSSALIEEYLEGGQEYSIECLVSKGDCQIIQYTQKDSAGAPHFVELGHHQPAPLTQIEKGKIDTAIKDILCALGIRCGMAHAELKIINGDVYFIEVGARAGGDHIADTLVPLSTDFDYFKGAIECALGKYERKEVHNVAYAGVYSYCKQNESLIPVFKHSENAEWCFKKEFSEHKLGNAICNTEAVGSGYIIYLSDEKLDIDNYKEKTKPIVVEINNLPNAYKKLWDYLKDHKSNLSDKDLDIAIKNLINKGRVLSIIRNYKITDCIVLSNNKIYTFPEILDAVDFKDISSPTSNSSLLYNKAIEILKKQ